MFRQKQFFQHRKPKKRKKFLSTISHLKIIFHERVSDEFRCMHFIPSSCIKWPDSVKSILNRWAGRANILGNTNMTNRISKDDRKLADFDWTLGGIFLKFAVVTSVNLRRMLKKTGLISITKFNDPWISRINIVFIVLSQIKNGSAVKQSLLCKLWSRAVEFEEMDWFHYR